MSENNKDKSESKEEPKRKVYAFDDGSLQSKVMFTEHSKDKSKELLSIQIKLPQPLDEMDSLNLEDYVTEIPEEILKNEKLVKLDLHFTQEDFDKFGLDNQINAIRGKYPNLSIIKSYSFMSRLRIERLAKQLGILKEKEKETSKPKEAAPEAEDETITTETKSETTSETKTKKSK